MTSTLSTLPFVTFYSFKGGVGRTMALLNVACILAGRGRRVLAIDLDLEAPGLTYLAGREQKSIFETPGFVDLVYDLLVKGQGAPIADPKRPQAFTQYTCQVPIPHHAIQAPGGELHIMPAGRIDQDYEDKLLKIDLGGLYGEGKGKPILEHIRNVIAQSGRFDYVLLDSRTGFSDEAGICIRDLGDRLVLLLGLNRQNVSGTARFLRRLRQRQVLPAAIAFVASPVPIGEDELRTERLEIAEKELTSAWGETVSLDIRIPYHPRLALDEDPLVFRWSDTVLYPAYEKLEEVVRGFADDVADVWLKKVHASIADGKHDIALQGLAEIKRFNAQFGELALRAITGGHIGNVRFDPYFVELYNEYGQQPDVKQVYGEHLVKSNRIEEGVAILREALSHFGEIDRDKLLACHRIIGEALANTSGKAAEALDHLESALAQSRKIGPTKVTVTILKSLASLRLRLNDEKGCLENLQEASRILKDSEVDPIEFAGLQCAMSEIFEKRRDYRNAIRILEDATRYFIEMGELGRHGLVIVRQTLGEVYRKLGDNELALGVLQDNLILQEELGDRAGAVATKHSINEIDPMRGERQRALTNLEESLRESKEHGDRHDAVVGRHSIAEIHMERGDYKAALSFLEEDLEESKKYRDRFQTVATQRSIAEIHMKRGEYQAALAIYEESLKLLRESGDRREVAVTYHSIAEIYRFRGEYQKAMALYEESLKVLKELDDSHGAIVTRDSIATIKMIRGDYQEAMALYEESLKVLKELHDSHGATLTQDSIATIKMIRGDYQGAMALYEESLKALRESGDLHEAAVTQHSIAEIFRLRGEYQKALSLFEESLKVKKEFGDRRGAALTQRSIAEIRRIRGDYQGAMALLEESLIVLLELSDRRGSALTNRSIAEIHRLRGEYQKAMALYEESLKVLKNLGDRREAAVTQNSIAKIHRMRGNYKKALALLEESLNVLQKLGDAQGTAVNQGCLAFTMVLTGREVDRNIFLIRNAISSLASLRSSDPLACLHKCLVQALSNQGPSELFKQALREAERLTAALGAKHYGSDIAVIRAHHLQELNQVDLESVRESLSFYQSQNILTPEVRIAKELLQLHGDGEGCESP